jgi:hypothetical protein
MYILKSAIYVNVYILNTMCSSNVDILTVDISDFDKKRRALSFPETESSLFPSASQSMDSLWWDYCSDYRPLTPLVIAVSWEERGLSRQGCQMV